MKWWKVGGIVFLIGSAIAGWIGYQYYTALFAPNINPEYKDILYIYPETTLDSFRLHLPDILIDPTTFDRAAQVMDFGPSDIKTGRYNIAGLTTNRDLINLLRSGNQEAVKVVIHNERDVELISGKLSRYFLMDSLQILNCLTTSLGLKEKGFTADSLLTLFIPNTYQMWWNTDCEQLTDRLIQEHDRFWNQKNRRNRASELEMSIHEVYTLASIVDRETISDREKPIVARVYLNRLRIGMPLQADPTIVFANKIFDTRRVLYKHLELDSPYNTYKYAGLPPGPIGIASISGIDAVLFPADHDYLYMVAKPDNSGLHNFSRSLTEHNRNARAYQRWLNQRGL